MAANWKPSDLAKKTNLPKQEQVQQIAAEAKARKLAADRAKAEQERQEFIAFIRQNTGLELIPEYAFHPERNWRYDFVNLEHRIALEIDGGIWQEISGHNSGTGILNAMQKRNEAVVMGWRPLHITPQERKSQYVIDLIKRITTAV